ncbi:hypothetical protein DCAR_0416660 [Daucus carota subsp. sativus]|uniref:non-specific serine/threonine protein kinase n=1 Tax=Daucus carota subsp. sativus TaxID=79200 RepID=A0AAF1AYR4_DAUCS|nr:hypothetical protein DCAR_0416660 [Daucus carota subsp. sativus]
MAKTCLFFALVLAALISTSCILCSSTDQSALLAFKSYITDDPIQILAKNWTRGSDMCSWIGVSCDASQEHVTALNLSMMSFKGTIAPHIGNLSFLTSLDLKSNQISGSLPIVLFNMPALRVINLSDNALSDNLPVNMCSNHSRLKALYLSSNQLHGEIPASLYSCRELQYLSLENNTFDGRLAKEIGNLTNLKHLYLGTNVIHGEIPLQIGNLRSLEHLRMGSNFLTGPVPSTLFNISSLETINLSRNKLSGVLSSDIQWNLPLLRDLNLQTNLLTGQIPSGLWGCKLLQMLSLAENSFTGSISKQIGNLTLLKGLNLDTNNFTGTYKIQWLSVHILAGVLPAEIGYLNLELLFVPSNKLSGEIPYEVFNSSTLRIITLQFNQFYGHLPRGIGLWLPNLEELYLGNNRLSGSIPVSLSNASKLTILEMSTNQFSGYIPNTLGSLRSLRRLHLGENNLTRESSSTELRFFYSLTNCRYLQVLELSMNQFHGSLPAVVGNLSTSLQIFSAFNSRIKGEIPIGIGNLSSLNMLTLDSNELTGIIPSTIGRLKYMERIYLEHNKLNGSVPYEICLLEKLGDLYLSDNQLSGLIPACLGELPSLTRLYLDSNKLTSNVPSTLWKCVDLIGLNLSTNYLSGYLPSEVGNLRAITEMDFSWNQFSGNIPATIGGAQSLNYLVLSHNKLEGPIPPSLGNLKGLEILDMSNNNLSGKIPKSLESLRYLRYFNISFNELEGEIPTGGPFQNFTGQSYLQNDGICGEPRLKVRMCPASATQKESGSRNIAFLKYTLPLIVAATLLVAVAFLLKRRRNQKIILTQEDSLPHSLRRFTYHELLQATNGFGESNLLGVGSVGSVYKGELLDGTVVAVKVFNMQFEGASKSFDAECEVLRNVRHRNLTRLISSCTHLDFKALILEWMPNGSLEIWLHSEKYCLNFLQRLNLMIDVASALDYLHCRCSTPIIHCDLKPSNVLIDNYMIAHVCDFGIAKLLGEQEFLAQTKTLGTIGYMAPEYGMEGIVTARGDVYSYGILLLETFTRKRPTEEMFSGEMSLKDWVKESLSSSEVLDTKLRERNDKYLPIKNLCALSIFNLAMDCLRNSPVQRIDMEDVLNKLYKIKTLFLEQCHLIDSEVNDYEV